MSNPPLHFFAASLPGLENMLADELRALGIKPEVVDGGCRFSGGKRLIPLVNLRAGLATYLWLLVGSFEARDFASFEGYLRDLPLSDWIEGKIKVKASSSHSKLIHTDAIIERVQKTLSKQGLWSGEGDDGHELRVHIRNNKVRVFLNTSGEPLYRRGYRLYSGKAPLRPDLARALLIASGWDRKTPLVDPCAGAGTLVIEAALLASGRAPGAKRSFAYESFKPSFRKAKGGPVNRELPALFYCERDEGSFRHAQDNAKRAGVDAMIEFQHGGLSSAKAWTESPFVVANPPYGKRIGSVDSVRSLYSALGDAVSSHATGAAIVCPDAALMRATNTEWESLLMTSHGGLKVRFWRWLSVPAV